MGHRNRQQNKTHKSDREDWSSLSTLLVFISELSRIHVRISICPHNHKVIVLMYLLFL